VIKILNLMLIFGVKNTPRYMIEQIGENDEIYM